MELWREERYVQNLKIQKKNTPKWSRTGYDSNGWDILGHAQTAARETSRHGINEPRRWQHPSAVDPGSPPLSAGCSRLPVASLALHLPCQVLIHGIHGTHGTTGEILAAAVTQLRTKHKRIIRHGVQVVDWIQHPSLVTWPNVRNIPSFVWSKLGSKEMMVKRSKVTTSCYHLISWINRSRLPIRSVESNPTCRPCALAKGAVVSIVIRGTAKTLSKPLVLGG